MPKPKDKEKFPLWAKPETLKSVKEYYRLDNCKSQSEFIEKAVLFYLGYLTAKEPKSFLPNMFISTMKSIVSESDSRTSRLLFKIAVELAMLQNIMAATNDIDEITLERLRGECVKEVKSLKGTLKLDDALDWQKG